MVNKKHISVILKTALCACIIFNFQSSFVNLLYAQKYACVNTDYVLRSIPDYGNAQKRLDKYVADWQKEIADKAVELDAMRAEYEQENYLLPDNLKKRRQEDMKSKEQEIRDLQQQRFGAGGDLDKKRAELLKPVQDRVYDVIERVAHEKNYAFVFDKAGSATVLFASKKYDISDEVLELLGYKPQAKQEQENKESSQSADKKKSEKTPSNPEMRRGANEKRNAPRTPMGDAPLKR
jgi:outer membrane protein